MSDVTKPDNNPAHLYPDFAAKVRLVLADLNDWCAKHYPGHTAVLYEGFRSQARQDWLYASGRSVPGPIKTKIKVSDHTSGLAADIITMDAKGNVSWNAPSEFWAYLRHCGHVHNCQSTSDYSSFVDEDHIQHDQSDHATYAKAQTWLKSQNLL